MSAVEADTFAPEGEEHEDREKWVITDKASADWVVRKLAKARAAVAENDALFKQEIDRLVRWQDGANKPHGRDIEYFESLLRTWHTQQLEADPSDAEAWKYEKNKTIKLPGGTLTVRQNPASVLIDDDDVFIKWALENHPAWVRVKYEPVKADIKAANGRIAETGEIAPGVHVVEGELAWKAVTE